MMIGKQIQQPVQSWNEYTKTLLWCNDNKAMIEDKCDWYEVVALPEETLDEAGAAKLAELNTAFPPVSETAHCMSSAGFEINADEIANRNIEGLVLVLNEGESTLFRDWDNRFHEVKKEQLETMRKEIVVNSQRLYQTKWQIEAGIEAAETVDELDAIDIVFETLAQTEGEGNGTTV